MFLRLFYFGSIILLLTFCSKSESPTDNNNETMIKGILKIQNSPVVNAVVQVDNISTWKTFTNEKGYFEIVNVTKGDHILKSSKTEENGQTVSVEATVSVNEGVTDLGEIRLPEPPFLYSIDTTELSHNKLGLRWSQSYDPEFREYKIYRKDDAGIDETTGELIFVSTESSDTTFIDDSFNTGLEYFYRVYTLSAFGKTGGSNILSITTPQPEIVLNGDFEQSPESGSIPGWNSFTNIFTLDSVNVYNGRYSLKASRPPEMMGDWNIDQDISASEFIPNRTYKFSVTMKSKNTEMGAFIFYYKNGLNLITTVLKHPVGADWGELTTEFQIPNDATVITVRLWIAKEDSYSEELIAWFDDVIIELM